MKLGDAPITQFDITEFLRDKSDFAFEMAVLNKLKKLGFECDHAGTFSDPISHKVRRYGIRARKEWGRFSVGLAVECLNPRPNLPLVIHTVPRVKAEAFHQVLIGEDVQIPEKDSNFFVRSQGKDHTSRAVVVKSTATPYLTGNQVGKAAVLVGREATGRIHAESSVTDRLSKAVNVTYDMIKRAHHDTNREKVCALVPLLIIPEGRVWQVDYDEDGNIMGGAFQTGHVSYFVGWRFRANPSDPHGPSFTVSHVEIVTVNNLEALFKRCLDPDEYPPGFLPFGEKLGK